MYGLAKIADERLDRLFNELNESQDILSQSRSEAKDSLNNANQNLNDHIARLKENFNNRQQFFAERKGDVFDQYTRAQSLQDDIARLKDDYISNLDTNNNIIDITDSATHSDLADEALQTIEQTEPPIQKGRINGRLIGGLGLAGLGAAGLGLGAYHLSQRRQGEEQ